VSMVISLVLGKVNSKSTAKELSVRTNPWSNVSQGVNNGLGQNCVKNGYSYPGINNGHNPVQDKTNVSQQQQTQPTETVI